MAKSTVEQEQVAAAPVVEAPDPSPEQALQAAIDALFAVQFGGDDGEYVPTDGADPEWDTMVREQVLAADQLRIEKEAIFEKMEANRTLLRAFATMNKVPRIVADYYYNPRTRKNKNGASAE